MSENAKNKSSETQNKDISALRHAIRMRPALGDLLLDEYTVNGLAKNNPEKLNNLFKIIRELATLPFDEFSKAKYNPDDVDLTELFTENQSDFASWVEKSIEGKATANRFIEFILGSSHDKKQEGINETLSIILELKNPEVWKTLYVRWAYDLYQFAYNELEGIIPQKKPAQQANDNIHAEPTE